ncbi:carboxypeptidase-like regulatory domain-containing protein [Mangrovimonas sp. CR14]|uniref:carboxypeptidase-like regulatory domain-containing protein n=1 Tax=Mangrovimonas sp. CR14 TaxID=2706120 RepID=UPI00141DB9C9|nr:carboxypeptidase-like regulatory domain-containing protein [Mangrovimonas sp. CR14]NIK92422.1 carboxypeptidase-like regulatory domain-containing protein [Mangrovimonas sp. CR14]
MKKCILLIVLLSFGLNFAQTKIIDKKTNDPVSFATISFGDGFGVFANDQGRFTFTKKLYPDIDTLYISALGYKDLSLPAEPLPETIFMEEEIDHLDEVVIYANLEDRKYKVEKLKPYLDDDYYSCWLPTLESEIAVFFKNEGSELKQLTSVQFPIALESEDWNKRKRSNADKKEFSTLFKAQFYKNEGGYPGDPLTYQQVTFRVTEEDGDQYDLDVTSNQIFIPENGLFISIQVMGYTDEQGNLLPNKQYKEIKSRSGMVKIPTNFRPLLPFTDEIRETRTFIKRVFQYTNEWSPFQKGSFQGSTLLKAGKNNYGMGISYRKYKDE